MVVPLISSFDDVQWLSCTNPMGRVYFANQGVSKSFNIFILFHLASCFLTKYTSANQNMLVDLDPSNFKI